MTKPTSLMTQYLNGQLTTRDLQDMMVEYAADARFERDLEFNSTDNVREDQEKSKCTK